MYAGDIADQLMLDTANDPGDFDIGPVTLNPLYQRDCMTDIPNGRQAQNAKFFDVGQSFALLCRCAQTKRCMELTSAM